MIELVNVSKRYQTRSGYRTVLNDVNINIHPGEKIGILGANGAGKSTMIRLLSGVEQPSGGSVLRRMTVSWPLAFSGGFQGSLTGFDNLRFICRVYGVARKPVEEFVVAFSELGSYMFEPVKTYSSGMRAKLAFALSMAVNFDCFLVDEVIAVGDTKFQAKCHAEIFEKRKDTAMIMVSHDANKIREYCSRASVIYGGRLHNFSNVEEAYSYYAEISG
jgi:capsular polysaccharide transport system ATP-binding protein